MKTNEELISETRALVRSLERQSEDAFNKLAAEMKLTNRDEDILFDFVFNSGEECSFEYHIQSLFSLKNLDKN